MFFNDAAEIPEIAKRNGFSIFVVPDETPVELKNALILQPEEKSVITVEQVRNLLLGLAMKQAEDQFILVRPAEKLGEEAENALLKSLEEPKEKVHFVLVASELSRLLPTVLSRAAVYVLKRTGPVDGEILADAKIKELAKRLIVAKPTELIGLAEEITKKKDGVRGYALEILEVSIEMLYKSYFRTEKVAFLQKLPQFLTAYENIAKNGHIKLHLVADLLK